MTDQTNAAPAQPEPAQPKIPIYRNPWLNAVVVLVGLLIDPLVLIYTLIILWTGPYYWLGKRPFKSAGTAPKIVMTLICVGALIWGYGRLIPGFQTADCSSPPAIGLVKDLAKRGNIAAVNYDQVEIAAIRTVDNNRPNDGATCKARMTNIRMGALKNELDITYTIDFTDKRDQILINLFFR
ncbi:hypothetical protein [Methylopila sp. M107]|uniref:hypothetical protein n=1 Tax=Methylopila sp. M107 TaxID=1101190 RepID=UPI000360AA4C|nr:hypothetical protein [Methylopila sp. M107]